MALRLRKAQLSPFIRQVSDAKSFLSDKFELVLQKD